MKKISWPFGALGMVTLATALFGVPTQHEGPVLVAIGPGHALSMLDSMALFPLLVGVTWLYRGFWGRRERISYSIRRSPYASFAAIFVAGFGLGLLIASAFSSYFWWWAIGAGLFGAMIGLALVAVRRG